MSTGLTWLTIIDNSNNTAPFSEVSITFSDYNEAYNYADWFMRAFNAGVSPPINISIFIYTSSPNNNGYYYWAGGVPVWYVFD